MHHWQGAQIYNLERAHSHPTEKKILVTKHGGHGPLQCYCTSLDLIWQYGRLKLQNKSVGGTDGNTITSAIYSSHCPNWWLDCNQPVADHHFKIFWKILSLKKILLSIRYCTVTAFCRHHFFGAVVYLSFCAMTASTRIFFFFYSKQICYYVIHQKTLSSAIELFPMS